MVCSSCGTSLPGAAQYCWNCGRAVKREAEAAPADAGAPTPQASLRSAAPRSGSAPLTLQRLFQIPRWPERFVREVREVIPALSAEEEVRLEQACWAHVDAVLSPRNEANLAGIEEELARLARTSELPWLAITPERMKAFRRRAG